MEAAFGECLIYLEYSITVKSPFRTTPGLMRTANMERVS